MGEAKKRIELTGYLTRREQALLGMRLLAAPSLREPRPGQPPEGNTADRRTKMAAISALGLDWVIDRLEDISVDPAWADRPAFTAAEMSTEPIVFTISKELLGWVRDVLDRIPPGGRDEMVLARVEERLADVARGECRSPTQDATK